MTEYLGLGEVAQTIIHTIPAEPADVERLLRRTVAGDNRIFSNWFGNVTLDAGDETLRVRLQETSWYGLGVPRPADAGVRVLSICEVNETQALPSPFAEATGVEGRHRRLMDIQLYRLDNNRSEVVLTRYSNAAPVARLHERMVERICSAWFEAPSNDGAAPSGIHSVGSDGLTPREEEIARLLARGLKMAEIAQTLMISSAGVKSHFKNISRKWELNTIATETMQKAARERLKV